MPGRGTWAVSTTTVPSMTWRGSPRIHWSTLYVLVRPSSVAGAVSTRAWDAVRATRATSAGSVSQSTTVTPK